MWSHDLFQALEVVVKVHHDLHMERNVFLEVLRSLVLGREEYAKQLVAFAEDNGGAHSKIAYIRMRFEVNVLTEVHDLLVQPTRADQVCMVLRLVDAR